MWIDLKDCSIEYLETVLLGSRVRTKARTKYCQWLGACLISRDPPEFLIKWDNGDETVIFSQWVKTACIQIELF